MLELTRTLSLPVVALVAGYTCSLDCPLQVWPWWPDVHLSGDVVGLGGLVYIPCLGNHVWPRWPFCTIGLPWCSLKVLRYLYVA